MKLPKFVIAGGILVLSLIAPPASAHTTLTSANPAENSTVAALPSVISLTFAEDLVRIGNSNSV